MQRSACFVACVVAFAACGGSTTNLGTDATDASTTEGGTPLDASAVDAPHSMPHDAGVVDAGGSCGKIGGDPPPPFGYCPEKQYCDQGAGKCHSRGTCRPITAPPDMGCSALVPVCGCDGKDYCDADDAQRHGVVVAMGGGCKLDCGPVQCNGLLEYCEHGAGGAQLPDGGVNEQWSCKQYPVACYDNDDRSCDCLKAANVPVGACSTNGGRVRVEQFFP